METAEHGDRAAGERRSPATAPHRYQPCAPPCRCRSGGSASGGATSLICWGGTRTALRREKPGTPSIYLHQPGFSSRKVTVQRPGGDLQQMNALVSVWNRKDLKYI